MPAATARAAYRLAQEGLTNAHKHAPGAAVSIAATGGHGGDVTVTVASGPPRHGAPEVHTAGSGSGLVGLGERLRLIGGTLHRGPDDAGGWRLAAVARRRAYGGPVITVLLVDDESLVRAGLRFIIDSAPDLEVTGEADDGDQAVAAVRRTRPDVVRAPLRPPPVCT